MSRFRYSLCIALSSLLIAAGCATTSKPIDEQARQRMLSLLIPSRIEICKPFTRVTSFDNDSTPDGIELLLQAVNALDNPGLMIAGTVRIELFAYVPASGLPRGGRYARWDVELNTEQQQRNYWNQLTQMYEFRLAVDSTKVPPADKYLLLVTYDSPSAERLTDEFVIGYRGAGDRGRGTAPSAG